MRFVLSRNVLLIFLALVLITLSAVLMSQCPALAEKKEPVRVQGFDADIPNLMEIHEGVYAGGQPTPEGVRRLTGLGIKTIVNLRPHEENGARDESPEAAELGIRYFNIPVTSKTFTYEKMQEVQRLLSDKSNYPVFVHCRSGNRSAGAWFLYRALFEKADVVEALAEAKALGLEPELERNLMPLLEQAKK